MGGPIGEDRILALLRDLPGSDVDPRRARDVRDRACALLARRQRRSIRALDALATLYGRYLEPALAGALALAFLAWIVAQCTEALHKGPRIFF